MWLCLWYWCNVDADIMLTKSGHFMKTYRLYLICLLLASSRGPFAVVSLAWLINSIMFFCAPRFGLVSGVELHICSALFLYTLNSDWRATAWIIHMANFGAHLYMMCLPNWSYYLCSSLFLLNDFSYAVSTQDSIRMDYLRCVYSWIFSVVF